MTTLVFDAETNGFLDQLDRLHCLVIRDPDSTERMSCHDYGNAPRIEEGLKRLEQADTIVGHNIIKFDLKAIKKVYPWFNPKGRILDTMILARLFSPELKKSDKALRQKNPKFPGKLVGSYTLEAFGYRLNLMKGEYKGPWDTWSQTMQDYCEQDVDVNVALWKRLLVKWHGPTERRPSDWYAPTDASIDAFMQLNAILHRQELHGFGFNEEAAAKFYAQLSGRRDELETQLKSTFKPWFRRDGGKNAEFTPKKDNKKQGYVAGAPFTKVKMKEFNPKAGRDIADRLMKLHGWTPAEFTEGGQPKVDETVIAKLPYPEAPLLTEYLMTQKRIGQLAEGKEAWLKHVKNGVIHGGILAPGTVTRRGAHVYPNIAQVPSVKKKYGKECRALFGPVNRSNILLGCDADALELRCLGGYMQPYDGGAYIETILKGKSEDGTDMHSVNCRALGMDPKQEYPLDGQMITGREMTKRWFYAFIYGGGNEKLGWLLGKRGDPNNPKHWKTNKYGDRVDVVAYEAGKNSKEQFLEGLPALGTLAEKIAKKVKRRGYLVSIDGGKLNIRSPHSALNALLQSAGALFMWRGLIILDGTLQREGLIPGQHYEFCANIHDEWQIEVQPEIADRVGEIAVEAIKQAGEFYKFPCPLKGNAKKGATWAETH
jgi:DNA polymerase-1